MGSTDSSMQIMPVIDIRNGIAVRAVAGERSQYRPLESRLTVSTEPAEVLKALQREFGFTHCYVADLDAIEGTARSDAVAWPHLGRECSDQESNSGNELNDGRATRSYKSPCTLAEMVRTGTKLILDAGIRSVDETRDLFDLGVDQVIVSSESWQDVASLPKFLQCLGADSITFSIDMKQGELLAADSAWSGRSPIELIETVVRAGIKSVIILDLAAVGTGTGIPTLSLCSQTKSRWPELTVISGGGVHSPQCLLDAESAGIDGVLIASALHDGRISASGGC